MRELINIFDQQIEAVGPHKFDDDRQHSIHEIPGMDAVAVRSLYEPQGRIEIVDVPSEVLALMDVAMQRSMKQIRRFAPSVKSVRPWVYVEYVSGQCITSHIDRIGPLEENQQRQILGVSVTLDDAYQGGEFFVETMGANNIWSNAGSPELEIVREGADASSSWFVSAPKTRWTTRAAPGTALFYGSQLAHGTSPVTAGRARKLISWLID